MAKLKERVNEGRGRLATAAAEGKDGEGMKDVTGLAEFGNSYVPETKHSHKRVEGDAAHPTR